MGDRVRQGLTLMKKQDRGGEGDEAEGNKEERTGKMVVYEGKWT